MRFVSFSLCVAVLLAILSPGAASGSVEISLGGPEVSGSGAGAVPPDAVTLLFEDSGSNTVQLTVSANAGAFKVKEIVFNVAPSIASLSFAYVSGVVAESTIFSANNQSLSGQLDDFDVLFTYKTSGPNGTLFNGQTSVYNLSAPGLTEESFNVLNNDGSGQYLGGVHINLPNGSSPSGKYGSTGGNEAIPEPASLLVWSALAACCAIIYARRRRVR